MNVPQAADDTPYGSCQHNGLVLAMDSRQQITKTETQAAQDIIRNLNSENQLGSKVNALSRFNASGRENINLSIRPSII